MSDNRPLESNINISAYNSLVASINYEYCKKHNYDFIYYRPYLSDINIIDINNCIDPNTNNPRHSAWSKILSTKLALQLSYDYIVYIDSDCIFKNTEQTIEPFIEPYTKSDVIFLNNKPWGDDLPCSGFYICKVCDTTKQFINDWYNVNIPEYNIKHIWEQAALWEIYSKYNIAIVDSWMFKEVDGQYLRHVGSTEHNIRIPYFLDTIKKYNINYSQNINNIQNISYSTTNMSVNNINVFIICYNESAMLPHTIKHYRKYLPNCTITILDNQSTDNSVEIATSLGCNCITWNTNNIIDDYKLRDLKNNCWKNVQSGWIIVADMDEFLYVTEKELEREYVQGTTILRVKGYDMNGESNTTDLTDIDLQQIVKYVDNNLESKNLCFLREKITDINYDFGAHTCHPQGYIQYSSPVYINKHMVNLGLPYLIDKMIKRYERSIEMRKRGLATHYTSNVTEITNRYNTALHNSKILDSGKDDSP